MKINMQLMDELEHYGVMEMRYDAGKRTRYKKRLENDLSTRKERKKNKRWMRDDWQ